MPVRYVCGACGAETTVDDNVACLSCPECGGKVHRQTAVRDETDGGLPEEDATEERDDRIASRQTVSDDTASGPVAESHSSGGGSVADKTPVKGLRVARPVKGLGEGGQAAAGEESGARPASSDLSGSEGVGKAEREKAEKILREAREQSEREAEEILRQAREKAEAESRVFLDRAREEAAKERESVIATAEESVRKSLEQAEQRAGEEARAVLEKARAAGQEAEKEARRIREQALQARSTAEDSVAGQIAEKADEILDEARMEAEQEARGIVQAAEARAQKIVEDAERSSEIAAEAAEVSVAAEAEKLAQKTLLDAERRAREILEKVEQRECEVLEETEEEARKMVAETVARKESDGRSETGSDSSADDATAREVPEEIDLDTRQKEITRNIKRRITGFTLLTSVAGGTVLYFVTLLKRFDLTSGFESAAMLLLLAQSAVFVWVFVSMWKLFFESRRGVRPGAETVAKKRRPKHRELKKSVPRRSTGSRAAKTPARSINARIARNLAVARSRKGISPKPGSGTGKKRRDAAGETDADPTSSDADAPEKSGPSEEHAAGETTGEKNVPVSDKGTGNP